MGKGDILLYTANSRTNQKSKGINPAPNGCGVSDDPIPSGVAN